MAPFTNRPDAPLHADGCQGFRRMPRRSALQAGSLGALGLSLADFLHIRAAQGANASTTPGGNPGEAKLPQRIKSVIQINLPGGFPQHESFDPKPEAPVEYRGMFGVVKTKNGDVFSEEESAVIRKAAEDPTSMFDMSTP
jgi:hypothetical protein